jgi:hypothetical protein
MVEKKTWKEFGEAGLLWWINMILHTFGWAIIFEIDDRTEEITDCYPARVRFRGFDEKSNTEGYIKLSEYLKENINEIEKEARE